MKLTLEGLTSQQVTAVAYAVDNPEAVLSLTNSTAPFGIDLETGCEVGDEVMAAKLRAEAQEKAGHVEGATATVLSVEQSPSAEDIFGTKTDSTPVATAAPTGVVHDVQPQTVAPTTGAAAASTVATASPSSEVDSAGMPWDARIHTANKSTVKAGTWKYKPKTDKALIAQIEQDYRDQGFGTPATAEPEPQQAAPAATVMPGVQPTAPAQAQVTQAVAQAPTESGVTFPMIVTQITMGISGNKFTAADVSDLLSKYGLSSSGELSVREDLLQPFWNDLEALANG